MAETMTEKGVGFAVLLNFIITIFSGALSSVFLSAVGGLSYIVYGGITFIVIAFFQYLSASFSVLFL